VIKMNLDELLNKFELYAKVNSMPILDTLLTHYLRAHEYTSDGKPGQGREITLMRKREDLSSRSSVFHEKCELAVYLDLLYSEEDIIKGVAHKESYLHAHNLAEKWEMRLLQHVAKLHYGIDLPLFVIFPTRPVLQLFDPNLDYVKSRIDHYLPSNTHFGLLSGNEKYAPVVFDNTQLDLSFRMFEEFGSGFTLPGFKESVEEVVRNFVKRNNRKYAHPVMF
jgi:hypothetical protein